MKIERRTALILILMSAAQAWAEEPAPRPEMPMLTIPPLPVRKRRVARVRVLPHLAPTPGLPSFPGPALSPLIAPGPAANPAFTPAPIPNRDAPVPTGPRASTAPELSPGLFGRRPSYRGEAYTPNSSAQSGQDRRTRPAAGFNFRVPLTPP